MLLTCTINAICRVHHQSLGSVQELKEHLVLHHLVEAPERCC
jgi:hypothetical protein